MVKRKLLLEEMKPTKIDGVGAGGREADIMAMPVEVEAGRRVFIFALVGDERALFTDDQVQKMAKTLGDTIHPAQGVFIVLPEGASSLRAWDVRG